MNAKLELLTRFLKKLLFWLIFPLLVLIASFALGEQFEVGRLSAIASCEGSVNNPACIRSKGYLANSPYYPDLTRRYFASYARMIGGDLGASYRVEPQLPALTLKRTNEGAEEELDDAEEQKASQAKDSSLLLRSRL